MAGAGAAEQKSRYPRAQLLSPELAGAGGLLIAGAVVAALVVHYQSHPDGPRLAGDYRAAPAAGASAWTADGPFSVRVDGISCTEADCTVRVEVWGSATAGRYLPPHLLADGGAALTLADDSGSGAGPAAVAPDRTTHLVYLFHAAADRPLSRLTLSNGAAPDALTLSR
ncbi:hypothetical protein ACEZCY_24345 [Streptacidiphilus sp. N1-12]|uniref:Uncharacterized protein n=2 Tax=Streptacidiphilus alkalitolerans TaxID=3342712 RepID=A0ABV6V829_9ACTN